MGGGESGRWWNRNRWMVVIMRWWLVCEKREKLQRKANVSKPCARKLVGKPELAEISFGEDEVPGWFNIG